MVRFIIEGQKDIKITFHKIYIPIWLDLLSQSIAPNPHTHAKFTFQYG